MSWPTVTSTFEIAWPVGAGLVGDQRLAEQARRRPRAASSRDWTSWTPLAIPSGRGLRPLAISRASARSTSGPIATPLPRPPAWTCALTTIRPPPSASYASAASSGVVTTIPAGTATPAALSRSLAWYSWTFIVGSSRFEGFSTGRARDARRAVLASPSPGFYHSGRGGASPHRCRGRGIGSGLLLDLALDPGDLLVGRDEVGAEGLAGLGGVGHVAEDLEPDRGLGGRGTFLARLFLGWGRRGRGRRPARLAVVGAGPRTRRPSPRAPCAGSRPGGCGGRTRRPSASSGAECAAISSSIRSSAFSSSTAKTTVIPLWDDWCGRPSGAAAASKTTVVRCASTGAERVGQVVEEPRADLAEAVGAEPLAQQPGGDTSGCSRRSGGA